MNLTWQAEEVLRAVRGQCLHEQTWEARGVAVDSHATQPGDLFVALKDSAHDAHDDVGLAFAKGAAAAIVQRAPSQVPPDAPLIFVDDTFAALQDLGRVGRLRAKAKIVAVTSAGRKRDCPEQLRAMLEAESDTYANEDNQPHAWSVPLSLARLPAGAHYGIFAFGMNQAGELGSLAREVHPQVSLIADGAVQDSAAAEEEIFLGMSPDGTAILNRDTPHYARLLAAARTQGLKRTLSFGHNAKSDARLLAYLPEEDGQEVKAVVLGQKVSYRIGTQDALASLGALLAAIAAGGDLITCAEALAAYRPARSAA
jgi:UDP-N-acetylmuramoyl-tripeptide--D-alanyl-D-alanine ligase